MNKLRFLLRLLPLRAAVQRPLHRCFDPAATELTDVDAVDERPCGCGWFDSSHELLRGLMVIEMPPLSQPLV